MVALTDKLLTVTFLVSLLKVVVQVYSYKDKHGLSKCDSEFSIISDDDSDSHHGHSSECMCDPLGVEENKRQHEFKYECHKRTPISWSSNKPVNTMDREPQWSRCPEQFVHFKRPCLQDSLQDDD